jgi:hypothetical protein
MTPYKRTKINNKVQYLQINSILKYKNKNSKQNKRWKNKKKEKKMLLFRWRVTVISPPQLVLVMELFEFFNWIWGSYLVKLFTKNSICSNFRSLRIEKKYIVSWFNVEIYRDKRNPTRTN